MPEQLTLQWPDQLPHSTTDWSIALRKGYWNLSESLLLVRLARCPDSWEFASDLSLFYIQRRLRAKANTVFTYLLSLAPDLSSSRIRLLQLLLDPQKAQPVDPKVDVLNTSDPWLVLFWVATCQQALYQHKPALMQQLLSSLDTLDIPEVRVAKAWYYRASGRLEEAHQLLLPICDRAPHLLQPVVLDLEIIMQAQLADAVMPALHKAVRHHGEHPSLLGFATSVNLLKRQHGLARRTSLLDRCWASVDGRKMHVDNHIATYENNGLGPWLEHLHASLQCNQQDLADFHRMNLHANRALQLSSIASNKTQDHLSRYLALLRQSPSQISLHDASGPLVHKIQDPNHLHIVWLTSDFGLHPVGRFLISYFEAVGFNLRHKHTVVSTLDRSVDSFDAILKSVSSANFLDVSQYSGSQRVAVIRRLKPDLVIDLNGWTSGHSINQLMARLAPLQVNYLGYFASTGLSEIDYWLGDEALFPNPMDEWHTEKIWRLPRPFIAWQPSAQLCEANVGVTPPPSGPIRFGSFNHTRKLSDPCLRLWSSLLKRIPNSRLVLKAHAATDPTTQTLLLRRMHRAGIQSDRVDWLPLTATAEQHLQQYKELDIALDCFPNGGCTTTFEALWMGVPVITLSGNHYVSRMSTAVLHGSDLDQLVASSEEMYLSLAIKYSQRIESLRHNRQQWRDYLIKSKAGDASGLMKSLEAAFSQMAVQHLNV